MNIRFIGLRRLMRHSIKRRIGSNYARTSRELSEMDPSESVKPAPCKTIFDLYNPWKENNIDEDIKFLPDLIKLTFKGLYDGVVPETLLKAGSKTFVEYTDLKGRTLLHFACAFGRFEAVQLLLFHGADANAVDFTNCITPLICASVIWNEQIMNALLEHYEVDINQGLNTVLEDGPSTALHWAVRAENVSAVKYLLERGASLAGSLMHRDTPLHEAASNGNHEILQLLLQKGSKHLELKGGKHKSTCLHVAVERGRETVIEALLIAGASPNSTNDSLQTPLHLAALSADFEAIGLLLMYGGIPDIQDKDGRTCLHYCPLKDDQLGVPECMDLLQTESLDINIQDKVGGYTAFHLAVKFDRYSLVNILLRNGADLTIRDSSGQSGLEILAKKMPNAIRCVKDSLDLALTIGDNTDTVDPNCTLFMDFRAIVTRTDCKNSSNPKKETEFLISLCKTGHKPILAHPLIEAFLMLKWQKVRKWFWASFIANLLMVLTYSWFLICVYNEICPIPQDYSIIQCNQDEETLLNMNFKLTIVWTLLMIMGVIFALKEFLQMIQSPKAYAKWFENYIQLFFLISIGVTTFPVANAITNKHCICDHLSLWEYRFAAVSIHVSFFLILMRLARLPRLGLYVQMLFTVVRNFGLFMIAYISILISFSLSFSILIDKPEFKNVVQSLQTVLVMMTGEIDIHLILASDIANQTYNSKSREMERDSRQLVLPVVTNFTFTAFVLLVTIVLANLLIGLAVSDIQGLHKNAKVGRLSRLVVAISQLESVLFSKGSKYIMPELWRKKIQRSALVMSSENKHFTIRPHDPSDTRLPQSLQMEALGVVERQLKIQSEKMMSQNYRNMDSTNEKLESQQKIKKLENAFESLETKVDKIYEFVLSLSKKS